MADVFRLRVPVRQHARTGPHHVHVRSVSWDLPQRVDDLRRHGRTPRQPLTKPF